MNMSLKVLKIYQFLFQCFTKLCNNYSKKCTLKKAMKTYFCIFDPQHQQYIFSYSILNSRSMDVSHDHIDYGHQISFLALKAYFHLFDPQKYIFLSKCKISERWIHHTTMLILGLVFRFWAVRLFDPQKCKFSTSV
jgi:hypothetical protein